MRTTLKTRQYLSRQCKRMSAAEYRECVALAQRAAGESMKRCNDPGLAWELGMSALKFRIAMA